MTSTRPDARGRFGDFGGQYAPETLMPALTELEAAFEAARNDPDFMDEYHRLLRAFVGRPTPVFHAKPQRGSLRSRRTT